MKSEELPVYQNILGRVTGKVYGAVAASDRIAMLSLAFGYAEPRHRLSLMTDSLQARILDVRQRLIAEMPPELKAAVAFYDASEFNAGSTLEDNILFGRVVYGIADGPRRVGEAMRSIIRDLGLRDAVLAAGLGFNVGSGGRRLSASDRQKVGLARALLKRPDLLVVNRGLGTLGQKSQLAIVKRVLAEAKGTENGGTANGGTGNGAMPGGPPFAVVWALSSPGLAKHFDRVVVFDEGRIVEQGTPQALLGGAGTRLQKMIS
jgi:putative ABC transport system ATP-binding protein